MESDLFEFLDRLANLAKQEIRLLGTDYGLLPIQHEALHYLSRCNKYSDTPIAVAQYLGLTKGTVSQTLKVLENKGLIERVGDPKDKRINHLSISDAGRNCLNHTTPPSKFIAATQALSKEQVADLVGGLRLLLNQYQVQTNRTGFGVCRLCKHNQKTDEGYWCGLTKEPLYHEETLQLCKEFFNTNP